MKLQDYPSFVIDRRDWLRGGNSYDNYPDGGVQRSSFGYNVFSKPGWLANSPDTGSTVDSGLPTGIGTSWGYGKGLISQQVMVVGMNSSQDASFYLVSSAGAFTKVGSDDTAHDYQPGKTWTIFYHSEFYTTSTTDITKNSYDLATRDTSWWVTTKGETSLDSFSPHPQVVYGDIHYIADGRYIHQNDNGTIQYAAFDLGQDWVITDMCVYNNLIYIAAEPYYNYSGTNGGFSKIFTWNGYADSWLDEYAIGPRINAMYVFKNVLYVWTPYNFGYFTGSVVENLWPMTSASPYFTYSSGITSTEDSMFFADGVYLIRYGSPYPRSGFRPHVFQSFVERINGVGSYSATGIEVCTTGSSNGSNFVFDSRGTPGGNKTFKFNTRYFGKPVKVRGYLIETNGMSSGQYVEVSMVDQTGTVRGTKRFGYAASAAMQGKTTWEFDVLGVPATTRLDPYITVAGDVYIRSIRVFVEPVEMRSNA